MEREGCRAADPAAGPCDYRDFVIHASSVRTDPTSTPTKVRIGRSGGERVYLSGESQSLIVRRKTCHGADQTTRRDEGRTPPDLDGRAPRDRLSRAGSERRAQARVG